MSFRAEEYAYNGGAHGGRVITVGTIEQATGRILKASDLIPAEKRAKTLAALYAGVVKKIGGKENLQGEVKITDNCFIAQDGIQRHDNRDTLSRNPRCLYGAPPGRHSSSLSRHRPPGSSRKS